jgi:hypothetical protein
MITLSKELPEDEGFLVRLYASTREEELTSWGWGSAEKE